MSSNNRENQSRLNTQIPIDSRDLSNGFLSPRDPLSRLSAPFDDWEEVATSLSKLALTRHIRPCISDLPPFPTHYLDSQAELERAMSMLSFMGNMYVFAPDHPVAESLPVPLASAWYEVAQKLGRPPMLTYASQVMYNWKRIRPDQAPELGNLVMIQNFLGGLDEEWFVTVHVNIEAVAGRALRRLIPAQHKISVGDIDALVEHINEVSSTLHDMCSILHRMTERCDPNIYYHRVRPYMFGWKNNPDLPQGMVYEGVDEYQGHPQQFRGETGAQSSVIYAIDGFLGITHEPDEMQTYLTEMRDYMPVQDRLFIETVERGASLRTVVDAKRKTEPHLKMAYNTCIEALHAFRKLHIEYAALYIIKPAHRNEKGDVGTGGTPFTVYLKKHIDETLNHRIL